MPALEELEQKGSFKIINVNKISRAGSRAYNVLSYNLQKLAKEASHVTQTAPREAIQTNYPSGRSLKALKMLLTALLHMHWTPSKRLLQRAEYGSFRRLHERAMLNSGGRIDESI